MTAGLTAMVGVDPAKKIIRLIDLRKLVFIFSYPSDDVKTIELRVSYSPCIKKANISEQVKSSFNEMFLPVIFKAEQNMERLENQGEKTLKSWGNMMKQYEKLWNKPFFLMLIVSLLLGTTTSFFSSYYLTRADRASRQASEKLLNWYATEYFKLKEPESAATPVKPEVSNQMKSQNQNKKKAK